MAESAVTQDRCRRAFSGMVPGLLFTVALLAPGGASALSIAPASLKVQQSYTLGCATCWTALNPGDAVTINNYIRITVTLVNDSGMLGALCADPGFPPGMSVPEPSAVSCGAGADPFDWITENDGVMSYGVSGLTSGQLWIWPVIGGCPNGLYPAVVSSPVSLVSVEPVVSFSYNGSFLDVVEAYDPVSTTWTTKTPMPMGRARFGVASAGGKFYVVGGRGRNGLIGPVAIYDPSADSWSLGADIPTRREGLAVAAANGKIYAIGGRGADGAMLGTVEEYDPGTNTWATKTAMPTPRYGLAAATVAPAGSDLIFAAGGYDGGFGPYGGMTLGTVEVFNPGLNSWSAGNTITPRADLGAASDGSLVWAVGGFDWSAAHNTAETDDDAVTNAWTPQVPLNFARSRLAVASIGGKVFALGGVQDSTALMDIAGYAVMSGNNEKFESGAWSIEPDMPTPRTWLGAAAANVAGSDLVFAIGGFTGMMFSSVADPDTAIVTWTFKATAEWTGLDFSILAVSNDDRADGNSVSGWEGSFYDCGIGGFNGTGTLKQIFTDDPGFNGTLNIVSQFKCQSRAEVTVGNRPPGVFYIGDTIRVTTSITNTGGPGVINSIDACAAWHPYGPSDPPNGTPSPPKGNVCVMPTTPQGSCSANSANPTFPVIPPADNIGPGEKKDYYWDFGVSGNAFAPGFLGCSAGAQGSGTVFWDVLIQGAKSETPFAFVQAAPLRITATAWVDPDGPLGAMAPVPMAFDSGSGAAQTYYFMGKDSVDTRFIFTNTSTVYTFDIEPAIAVGGADAAAFMMLAGPTPAGPLLLAPGQSATVAWAFTRTPGGTLDSCAPSVIGNVETFTAAARGAAATQSVRISDVPFRPFDAVPYPPGAPLGSRALTFAVGNAPQFTPFQINLYATNTETRDFVLDPAVQLYLSVSSYGGAVSWTSSPSAPPPWSPGQTQTLSWVYMADLPGEVRFQAGLDFSSVPPPCMIACRESGVANQYCNATDGFYPWQRMFVTIPGALTITSFTVTPPLTCNDSGILLQAQMTVKNSSSIFCAEVSAFCDAGSPTTLPADFAATYTDPGSGFPPSPSPMTAIALNPGQSKVVTWYMHPTNCSANTSFGCFSGKSQFAQGRTYNCGTGATINPADGADWAGVIPVVAVTQPASLVCSIWTDPLPSGGNKSDYSVGQVITVYFSVSNEGGDDLTNFTMGITPTLALGAAVGVPVGPAPPAPVVYAGSANCAPSAPFNSNETFVWQFATLQRGKVSFTITAGGFDPQCGTWKTTACQTGVINIASSAQLACAPPAVTPVVTMSATCVGCPLASECDRGTGAGCLNVSMDLSNFGDIPVQNVDVSLSSGPPAMRACVPAGSCLSGSVFLLSRTMPPTVLGTLASGTAVWRYAPTALGCLQVKVEATGNDTATGVTLYCDGWTSCATIKARYPMQISLESVPPQIAPGQQFAVKVKVCNPGDTPAALQPGQPAFQFFLSSPDHPKVTDQYDALPPAPTVLKPGECRVIDVMVTAHSNAEPGTVEIRVAEGSKYVAMDAATNYPFSAVDAGLPMSTLLINLQNKLSAERNPVHILRASLNLMYQVADSGAQGGRTTLRIYTISGELVRTLVDKTAVIEEARIPWDGRNDRGQLCASGVYLARLESPSFSKVVKIAILK